MSKGYQLDAIRVERVYDGRKLTHPSGLVTIETAKVMADERLLLLAEIKQAKDRLVAFDEDAAELAKLDITVVVIGELDGK